ncbi:hypothetical protein [Vibrio furnissii]|uniref:hypothetical protein n=1 Tax=Vibrio furnissii TaxID=29494 RepID=UPI001EEC57D5|nr:hypothetical protein [Vibrio furnissii]
MSMTFCESCNKETEHKEVMKQKKSKYSNSKKDKVKEFFDGFFSASSASLPAGASLELTDRYIICTKCGKETLENHGTEFQ